MKKRNLGRSGLAVTDVALAIRGGEATLAAGVAGGCNFYWTDEPMSADAVIARRVNPPAWESQSFDAAAWEALIQDTARIDIGTVVANSTELLLDAGLRSYMERHKGIRFHATGVSVGRPDDALLAIDIGGWDVVFMPYSVFQNHDYVDVFDRAVRRGIGLVAMDELVLSDDPGPLMTHRREVRDHLVEALPGRKFLDLAVQFALARDEVSSVLVPVRTPAEVQEVLQVDDHANLSADDIEMVQRVSLGLPARRS